MAHDSSPLRSVGKLFCPTAALHNETPMSWLDRIPLAPLAVVAVLMALAPFVPEPHLWEKLKMLSRGDLTRPLDIFDLALHATPLIVLGLKLLRLR